MNSEIKVLDRGFVHYVEGMGYDRGVVQAARVCYKGPGTKTPAEDKKLVAYLMAHEHMTPFEHAVLKFHVKAPLFVARQWFRHRSSSYNEESQRYAEVAEEFYYPAQWRAQGGAGKQGSQASSAISDHLETEKLGETCAFAMARYRQALDRGVAKEMARMHLPVNVYTSWYWTVSARNLMAFIKLRSEKHAQWEIRQYSNALWQLWAPSMPWTAEAFLANLGQKQNYVSEQGEITGPCPALLPAGA